METGDLDWREGGVPVSRRFDDPYFSLSGGLEETRHGFLAGTGLPGRLRDGFTIAELGFGTGLNLLALMAAWDGPGRVGFVTFEAWPLGRDDAARAHAAFPELAAGSARLLGAWDRLEDGVDLGPVRARLVRGDARTTVPAWEGRADAWFLDGFAPARNAEMWEPGLLAAVAERTAPGGRLATFTAAGHVRRALAAAGLEVARVPGYGRKRHMTVARKAP